MQAVLWPLLIGITAMGCAPTPAQKAQADLATIKKESDAKILFERGKAFAAVGDHTRAEEYLAASMDAGADPREVLPLLLDVCVRTGRYRSAIQHAENHLHRHPNDFETRVMVGALYTAINEGKQARAQLEKVLTAYEAPSVGAAGMAPPQPERPTTDGDVSEEPGDPPGGRSPKREPAARKNPPRLQAQAHYLLGVVARDSENDVVEADRHFREYLRIEPNGSHAEEAKASLLKRLP